MKMSTLTIVVVVLVVLVVVGLALSVRIPTVNDDAGVPRAWPIGFYTVTLVVSRPNLPPWTTNALPFALVG